ncbi:MAG: hypothetical protein ACE5JS_06295 [Nitrospinota bacterium]
MWDRLKPGPKYEALSQAILQAILSSKEVQARVDELLRQGALDGEDIVALALRFLPLGRLEAKVDLMRKSSGESAEVDVGEDEALVDGEEGITLPLQDVRVGSAAGRKMTPNELAFEKFLQDRFDEKAWMREARIRFLSKGEEGVSLPAGERPNKDPE